VNSLHLGQVADNYVKFRYLLTADVRIASIVGFTVMHYETK